MKEGKQSQSCLNIYRIKKKFHTKISENSGFSISDFKIYFKTTYLYGNLRTIRNFHLLSVTPLVSITSVFCKYMAFHLKNHFAITIYHFRQCIFEGILFPNTKILCPSGACLPTHLSHK